METFLYKLYLILLDLYDQCYGTFPYIDITKNVFQHQGVNRNDRAVLKCKVIRVRLLGVIGRIEP